MWRKLIICTSFLALAACSSDEPQRADVAEHVSAPLFRITPRSAGPVNAETPYSSKALQALLPGFEVRPIETAVEHTTLPAFAAFSNGLQVAQFLKGSDGKVGQVFGVSDRIVGPNGERIGMTISQLRINRASCRMGQDLWTDMAICPAHGTSNISLVFAVPGYRGPLDQLPPPDELKDAILQRIVWKA